MCGLVWRIVAPLQGEKNAQITDERTQPAGVNGPAFIERESKKAAVVRNERWQINAARRHGVPEIGGGTY